MVGVPYTLMHVKTWGCKLMDTEGKSEQPPEFALFDAACGLLGREDGSLADEYRTVTLGRITVAGDANDLTVRGKINGDRGSRFAQVIYDGDGVVGNARDDAEEYPFSNKDNGEALSDAEVEMIRKTATVLLSGLKAALEAKRADGG